MLVTIAGVKKELEQAITIAELIETEQVDNAAYVTVTLNDEFLERQQFEDIRIKDQDVIEFLYFMGGGAK